MKVWLALVLLVAWARADDADEALEALKNGKSLKLILNRVNDWVVADELCARKEFDAALAVAKAANPCDKKQLPEFIEAERKQPVPKVWREAIARYLAATALRKAQAHVASRPGWSHPYFWAAWQLWGRGE